MKIGRWAALAALAAGCLIGGAPAQAQFAGFTGNARFEATSKPGATVFGSVNFYPFASFATGGNFANGTSGTSTDNGVMVAGDIGFKPAKTKASFEFGGWYWTKNSSDLFQLDVRAFWTPEWGFQAAYLASSTGPPTTGAATFYALYDLSSKKVAPHSRRAWALEFGLGMFLDPSQDRSTTSASFYVQGSVEIAKHVSLTASQWYVRDRSADLNRFALGIGYNF